jgi:hypothetical protein
MLGTTPMRKIPAATVALAAMAIPLAAPASADPVSIDQLVSGMYNVHFTDGSLDDVRFKATSCGIGCAQIDFSNASGQGRFYADRWHANFPPNPAAWRCADGTLHGGTDQLSWDPATGIGMMSVARTGAACGYSDHTSQPMAHPFTLTRSTSQSEQPGILPPAVS